MSTSTRIRIALPPRWATLALPSVAAILWMGTPAARAEDALPLTPFSSAHGEQPPEPWHFSGLPNKVPTRFEVVQQDGRKVLKVEADQSYGNLVHPVHAPLNASTTLRWRWRVDDFVKDADLHTRSGDDGAAKICVFFDFPTERLSLGERTRLALARRTTGEEVPSETLCYVWDIKEAKGTELVNAFTKRIRMVIVESGPAASAGAWVPERRNLLADYRRAFGEEAGDTVPDIVAVAISADADNTHGHGLAYFSDIDLRSIAAPSRSAETTPAARPAQGD